MGPLDELVNMPGAGGDFARERVANPPLPMEMPEETATREITQQAVQQRVAQQVQRSKAGDFARRGIPSYTDETGVEQAVRDANGAAITSYKKGSNVGYDGAGNPVSLKFGETGPPTVEDAFAGLPVVTKKDGNQYKIRNGLPWMWVGQDQETADAAAQKEKDAVVAQTATALGRKLTLDERALKHDEVDYKTSAKQFAKTFGLTGQEDHDTARAQIDQSFNNDVDGYASPQANETRGWFGGQRTPEADAYRAEIDARKAAALSQFDALKPLGESIAARRTAMAPIQETRDALVQQGIDRQLQKAEKAGITIPGINQPEQPAEQAPASPPPTKKAYTIANDHVKLDEQAPFNSLNQAVEDGLIPKPPDDVLQAAKEKQQIIEAAGSHPEIKAAIAGAGRGAAFLAASEPGALAGTAIGAAIPGVGETGISEGIGAVLGGLITGSIGAWGYGKVVDTLAKHNDTINSFVQSAKLHPNYAAGGELVAFAKNAPKAIKNLVELGSIASESALKEGASEAAAKLAATKIIGRKLGEGAVSGLVFEGAVRPSFDAARYVVADQLGIAHDEFQSPDAKSLVTMAALGMLTAGHSLKFKDYDAKQIASVMVRTEVRDRAGIPMDKPLTVPETVEAYKKAGVDLNIDDVESAGRPLSKEERGLYESLAKTTKTMQESGKFKDIKEASDVKFESARQAIIPGLTKGSGKQIAANITVEPGSEPRVSPTGDKSPIPGISGPSSPKVAPTPEPASPPTSAPVVGGATAKAVPGKPVTEKPSEPLSPPSPAPSSSAPAPTGPTATRSSIDDSEIKPPEGVRIPPAQTSRAHIVSTAVNEGGKYLVGERFNEPHAGIGALHDMPNDPRQDQRGFIVQREDGTRYFESNRNEAAKIAKGAGQTDVDRNLQSTDLKPVSSDERRGSTQVTLSDEHAKPIRDFVQKLPDADLYHGEKGSDSYGPEYGREMEPHVTTLYGLTGEGDNAKAVAKVVKDAGIGPVKVKLGKVTAFENADRPYDVLKVDVTGDGLHALNKALKKLPHSSDFPDYHPHLTLAYVKKGTAKKYVGGTQFEGQEITLDELTHSSAERSKTKIPLSKSSVEPQQGSASAPTVTTEAATPSAGAIKAGDHVWVDKGIGISGFVQDINKKGSVWIKGAGHDYVLDISEVERYEAKTPEPKAQPKALESVVHKNAASALNEAPAIKVIHEGSKAQPDAVLPTLSVPRGTTHLQVTNSKGQVAQASITDVRDNSLALKGGGPYTKIEPGKLVSKKFVGIGGKVKLATVEVEAEPKKTQAETAGPTEPPAPPKKETPANSASENAPDNQIAAAVEEIADEIIDVRRTDGARPAREIKAELVARLKAAINKAPSMTELLKDETVIAWSPGMKKYKGPIPLAEVYSGKFESDIDSRSTAEKNGLPDLVGAALTKAGAKKIHIPGDGTFMIWNTRQTLAGLLKRVEKMPVTIQPKAIPVDHGEVSMTDVAKAPNPQTLADQYAIQFVNYPEGTKEHDQAEKVLNALRRKGVVDVDGPLAAAKQAMAAEPHEQSKKSLAVNKVKEQLDEAMSELQAARDALASGFGDEDTAAEIAALEKTVAARRKKVEELEKQTALGAPEPNDTEAMPSDLGSQQAPVDGDQIRPGETNGTAGASGDVARISIEAKNLNTTNEEIPIHPESETGAHGPNQTPVSTGKSRPGETEGAGRTQQEVERLAGRKERVAELLQTHLAATGSQFKLVEHPSVGGAGIETRLDEPVVAWSPEVFNDAIKVIEDRGLDASPWLKAIAIHESIHAADIAATGYPGVIYAHQALTKLMTPEMHAIYADYFGSTGASVVSSEHVARVIELRNTGTFTEEFSGKYSANQLAEMRRILSAPQPEEIERHIQRVMKFMETGEKIVMHDVRISAPGESSFGGPTVYHGTPHEVDKFSTDRIGTGEGNQSYGWGLYFAEEEQVAKDYQRKLSSSSTAHLSHDRIKEYFTPGKIVPSYGGYDRVISFNEGDNSQGWSVTVQSVIKNANGEWVTNPQSPRPRNHATTPTLKQAADAGIVTKGGNKYTVEITANEEDFLDWDKAVMDQPQKIKDAVANALAKTGQASPEKIASELGNPNFTGERVIGWLGSRRDENPDDSRERSEALLNEGIAGIRYLDEFSRGKSIVFDTVLNRWAVDMPDGTRQMLRSKKEAESLVTHNYVVFDASKIKITHKNGEPVSPREQSPIAAFGAPHPGRAQKDRLRELDAMANGRRLTKAEAAERNDLRTAGVRPSEPDELIAEHVSGMAPGPKEKSSIGSAVKAEVDNARKNIGNTVYAAIAGARAAFDAIRRYAMEVPKFTTLDKAVGEWLGAGRQTDKGEYVTGHQKADLEAKRLTGTIASQFSGASLDAMTIYRQAGMDEGTVRAELAELRSLPFAKQFVPVWERAVNLSGAEKAMAKKAEEFYSHYAEILGDEDVLQNVLENYVNQEWDMESMPTAVADAAKNKLGINKIGVRFNYAQQRKIGSYFNGIKMKLRPKTLNLGKLMGAYAQSANHVISNRHFLQQEMPAVTADDGRPGIVVSGIAKATEDDPSDTRTIFVNPKAHPPVKVGEEQLATKDYEFIPHPSLTKAKWVGQDENGNPVILQGDLLVHPQFAQKLRNMLLPSALRDVPAIKQVRKANQFLKESILSASGFHLVHIGTHVMGHGITPWNLPEIDPNNPIHRALMNHGLSLAPNYNARAELMEGVASRGGLLSKIPWLGPLLQQATEWQFENIFPRLNLKLAMIILERNRKRWKKELDAGKMTEDQLLDQTARQSNDAIGLSNDRYEAVNPTATDVANMTFFAWHFLKDRIRYTGDAFFTKHGEEQRRAIFFIALGMILVAKAIERALTGRNDWQKPFSVVDGTREFTMRSIPADFWNMLTEPRRFINGRLSPLISRPILEALSGRDFRGMKRSPKEQLEDIMQSGVPIPFKGLLPGQETGKLAAIASASGLTVKRHSDITDTRILGHKWQQAHGIENPDEAYPPSKYLGLKQSLEDGDMDRAKREYATLVAANTKEKVDTGFRESLLKPFAGSRGNEQAFAASLDSSQRAGYKRANAMTQAMLTRFLQLSRTSPAAFNRSPALQFQGFN